MTKSNTSDTVILGNLGSTGRSTGPHLHLGAEVQRPGEKGFKRIDPGSIKSQLANFGTVGADGGFIPLTVQSAPGQYNWNNAFQLTSGFRSSDRPNHQGVDVVGSAIPTQGMPWHVKKASNIVGFGPGVDDPYGYGDNGYVETVGTDGSRYRFTKAHLAGAPNTWTNPNFCQTADSSQTPAAPVAPTPGEAAQKLDAGTVINLAFNLGKNKDDEKPDLAQTLLKNYIGGLFTQPDLMAQVGNMPNPYANIG